MNAEDLVFAEVWRRVEPIEGWLTSAQGRALFGEAGRLRAGDVAVEIGSHQGRSTVVLASALPPGARLVAVDPFDPAWKYGRPETQRVLERHLRDTGVADRVTVVPDTSAAARAAYQDRVDLLYIDGKHDYWTVRDDVRWSERLPEGGVLLVHDAFGSVGVTLALLRTLAASRHLCYTGRTGSLARLEVRRPTWRDRLRPVRELPWWWRNLGLKALLRLRLRAVARAMGHRDTADPY